MKVACFVIALLASGCVTTAPVKPVSGPVVYVPKQVPVIVERPNKVLPGAIDPEWLKPCPTDEAKEESYDEAKRLSQSRLKIIINCDHADKAKIRAAIETAP